MKHYSLFFIRLILPFLFLTLFCASVRAQQDASYQMENMHVTIPAVDYKSAHFIERVTVGGKEYIMGKPSSYKKNGEANAGTLLQPHAEYVISSKLSGGSYHVLVYYSIDREKAPETPKISIGMNTQKAQEVELSEKSLSKYAKATFKVNFLKGKKHTVKLWFPSEGVRVREIKVMRALFNKKGKSSEEE